MGVKKLIVEALNTVANPPKGVDQLSIRQAFQYQVCLIIVIVIAFVIRQYTA